MTASLVVLAAFLLGSVPSGAIVFRRATGADIRDRGSGGGGASNVFREGGAALGLATLVLDLAKGAAATLLARAVLADAPFVAELSALAATSGHILSPWMRFRGGKGAATAAGANLVLYPAAVAVALALFFVVAFGTRYASLGTTAATVAFVVGVAISGADGRSVLMAAAVGALVLFMHRRNFERLLRGEEPPLEPPRLSR